MRAALGGEPAVHDRERALGVGAVDRRGQREVRAQPVVAHAVVELDVHAEEPLAGAQLEGGTHVDGDASRRCGAVHDRSSPIACAGQRYVGGRRRTRARTGPDSSTVDAHRLGPVDDECRLGGRRVVVGVAAVAAVDERSRPATRDAVGRSIGERAVGGVDLDLEVLVRERRAPRRATAVRGPVALDRAVRRASRSRGRAGVERATSRTGARRCADRDGGARLAEREQRRSRSSRGRRRSRPARRRGT